LFVSNIATNIAQKSPQGWVAVNMQQGIGVIVRQQISKEYMLR
jgi:hypothetical protein